MSNQLLIAGVDRYALLRNGSLRVSRRLDHRNTCSFTMETTAGGYIPPEGADLKVNINDDTQFGGIIKTVEIERPGVGTDDDTTVRVLVSSDGYGAIPYRRTINALYEAPTYATAGSIVSKLMETLSEEGIQVGNIQAGAAIELYSGAAKSIGTILDELADMSGFIWYINSEKSLYFIESDILLNDSRHIDTEDIAEGSFHDFAVTSFSRDMTEYANKVFVRGGIQDDGTQLVVSVEDTAEIAARKAAEGGSGVYGYIHEDTNLTDTTAATTVANAELRKRSRIPRRLSFRTRAAFEPQFKLQVRLPAYGITALEYYLIEQVDIEEDAGRLAYTVTAVYRNQGDFSGKPEQSVKGYFDALVGGGGVTTVTGSSSPGNEISASNGGTGRNRVYVDAAGSRKSGGTAAIQLRNIAVCDDATAMAAALSSLDEGDLLINKETSQTFDSSGTIHRLGAQYVRFTGSAAADISVPGDAVAGDAFIFKNRGSASATLKGTFDGAADLIVAAGGSVRIQFNGTDWDSAFIGGTGSGGGGSSALTCYADRLVAAVPMPSTGVWYDGPSVFLTEGTWMIFAYATVRRTATTATTWFGRVVQTYNGNTETTVASTQTYTASLSGICACLSMVGRVDIVGEERQIILQCTTNAGNAACTMLDRVSAYDTSPVATRIMALKIG